MNITTIERKSEITIEIRTMEKRYLDLLSMLDRAKTPEGKAVVLSNMETIAEAINTLTQMKRESR